MESNIDDFIWPNRHLLNFLGFWPREPNLTATSRFFGSFRIVLSILVVSTMFVPEILALIVYWGDISKLTDVGSVTIEVGQLVFKMFYMLLRQRKFCHIYKRARAFWRITEEDEERENLERLARLAQRITISLWLMGMSNIFTFVPVSIIVSRNNYRRANYTADHVRYLPLEVWYGVNTNQSPHFEIAILVQTIGMIFGVAGIAGFDATMVTLILHVSGQFRLLSTRFRNIGNQVKLESRSDSRRKISLYIEHHKRILRMASDMRELLSPVIFVQLMSSGLEICLCGYSLVIKGGSSVLIAKYIIYTITMFLQLVLWCWPGELLIQESTAVGDVICHELPWYLLPADLQHDLGLVIMRTQKECCVTALDFQIMSMSKLTEVFNTAISYFALLRSATASDKSSL